jgi:hypothetical protein
MRNFGHGHSPCTLQPISQPVPPLRRPSEHRFHAGINCLVLILLSGCADHDQLTTSLQADGPPTSLIKTDDLPPPSSVKAYPKIKRPPVIHEAKKMQPDEAVTTIAPSTLLGKEPSAIANLLGAPASVTRSDVSVVWTYNYADCAFQIYFYPDIKTSVFHALQYSGPSGGGDTAKQSSVCARHLLMARNNGTN